MNIQVGDRIKYAIRYKGKEPQIVDVIITGNSDLSKIKKWISEGDIRVIKIERPVYKTKFDWKNLSEEEKEKIETEYYKKFNKTKIERLEEELEIERNKTWLEKLFDW